MPTLFRLVPSAALLPSLVLVLVLASAEEE